MKSFSLLMSTLGLFAFTGASISFAQDLSSSAINSSVAASLVTYDKSKLAAGSRHHIQVDLLNMRNAPSGEGIIVGSLLKNDLVEIVDPLGPDSIFVQIRVVSTKGGFPNLRGPLFISSKFLHPSPARETAYESNHSKYFVIQNVATETVRVYERCFTGRDCRHRMILEADMVVGRRTREYDDKAKYFTWLGRYKITNWVKFYQDSEMHYPSWFDPKYPAVPAPGAKFKDWFKKDIMPTEAGVMRGAFGWYAGMIAPNANGQWLHGTAGWGSDGDKFIQVTRNFFVNIVKDARSSGCTRVENGLVAYLRDILPPGTEIIRVYAFEGLEDESLADYENQRDPAYFEYILTAQGVRGNGTTIAREEVLRSKIPQSQYLEEGRYTIDRYPDARKFKSAPFHIGAGTGALGNVYRLKKKEFNGVYMVDSGRLVNYAHPASLPKGGLQGSPLPEYAMSNYGGYSLRFLDDSLKEYDARAVEGL